MAISLKPGKRVFSAVCTAEFIVVKAPAGGVDLTAGGVQMETTAPAQREGSTKQGEVPLVGKRYADAAQSMELLCTRAGDEVPALDGERLQAKDAKPLPASD